MARRKIVRFALALVISLGGGAAWLHTKHGPFLTLAVLAAAAAWAWRPGTGSPTP